MQRNEQFRTSTYSFANGNCVEIGTDWRKSGRSVNGGACVEAGTSPGAVLVRDTTDRGGVTLAFGTVAWREFLGSVKQ